MPACVTVLLRYVGGESRLKVGWDRGWEGGGGMKK